MRVGINLVPLRPGQSGGAEVYVRDLLAEWLRRGHHQFVLFTAEWNHESLPEAASQCRRLMVAREPGRTERLLRQLAAVAPGLSASRRWIRRRRQDVAADAFRARIAREELDLWFCPFTNLEPRRLPIPGVVTVYDLQHECYPEFFSREELAYRREVYPESCAAATHVITISEFTRAAVLERYGVAPARVTTVELAADPDFAIAPPPERVAEAHRVYGLPPRYALYPANTWLHKNHARLIQALARYGAAHGDELGLVLTGVPANGQHGVEEAVQRHGVGHLVRVLGYVPRDDLRALYAGAACLVYPSLFEGFGLPLVEAMLSGCPIVASRTTSIPEIVGDAAVLVDPLDSHDITRGLESVLRDPRRAAELVSRGRARASRFSVQAMANRTIRLFEVLASAPQRALPAGAPTPGR